MRIVARGPGRAGTLGPGRAGTSGPDTTALRHTIITFGPFNGRPVCELEDWYLFSLAGRRLWPRLARAVEAELGVRSAARRRAA
jgi:hypothetical protein